MKEYLTEKELSFYETNLKGVSETLPTFLYRMNKKERVKFVKDSCIKYFSFINKIIFYLFASISINILLLIDVLQIYDFKSIYLNIANNSYLSLFKYVFDEKYLYVFYNITNYFYLIAYGLLFINIFIIIIVYINLTGFERFKISLDNLE